MSLAYHCDRDGCDTWAYKGGICAAGFLSIDDGDETLGHFCCLDCLTHWAAARSEPTETVPL